MDEPVRAIEPQLAEVEDLALDSILALRRRWALAERRRGGVTLRALGLELPEQQRYLSAVCTRHGRFHWLWTAGAAADRPVRIVCPGAESVDCGQEFAVDFTYEPARPRD